MTKRAKADWERYGDMRLDALWNRALDGLRDVECISVFWSSDEWLEAMAGVWATPWEYCWNPPPEDGS